MKMGCGEGRLFSATRYVCHWFLVALKLFAAMVSESSRSMVRFNLLLIQSYELNNSIDESGL